MDSQAEYSVDLQCGKKPYEEGDHAENPLFTYVKDEVFSRPTYATFVQLLVSPYRPPNPCIALSLVSPDACLASVPSIPRESTEPEPWQVCQ